tara:strand:- start:149 stop:433 length:285 start_codon:yes stop_codon:yes gene_type:complete
MRYLKKDYFKERLIDLRNRLKLIDGTIMSSDKHLISLIFRGFSNSQINDLVREQFKYFDMPSYWKRHKSLRLNDDYANYYKPKYKQILMENING